MATEGQGKECASIKELVACRVVKAIKPMACNDIFRANIDTLDILERYVLLHKHRKILSSKDNQRDYG
jgi:hypothetical protein